MIKGAGIGAGIIAIFTVFWKVIKFIAEVIAKLIIYLGLWAPLLYLAYGGILKLIYKDLIQTPSYTSLDSSYASESR